MDVAMSPWEAPSSIKDAESRKDKTLSELFSIDAQLNNKNLTDENGKRYDTSAYQNRRQALLRHKTKLLKELKRLRGWIHATREGKSTESVLSDTALLQQAYRLLAQLKEDGVDFEPDELRFIEVLASRVES